MCVLRDRTEEFHAAARTYAAAARVGSSAPGVVSPPSVAFADQVDFAKRTTGVHDGIEATKAYLLKLRKLATTQSTFDDPAEEFQALSQRTATGIQRASTELESLTELHARDNQVNRQQRDHMECILRSLKTECGSLFTMSRVEWIRGQYQKGRVQTCR